MSKPVPRVLFVSDKFGYEGGVSHGGTTYFMHVFPALIEAGVSLTTCFLRDPHPAADNLRQRGVDPIFLSAWRMDPTVAFRVAGLARQHGCTVIHAAGIKASLMARIAARLVSTRVIVHVHDQKDPGILIRALNRIFARPTDLGICVSHAVQSTAIGGYRLAPGRLRVVPNGLRLDQFRQVGDGARERVRAKLGIAAHTRVLGMFGRFFPVKGHRLMLAMLPHILAEQPDTLLLLAGDGPERQACEAIVDELSLRERVIFLGQRDDIPELLTSCDLFLMTSQTEGLPLAAIEALAMGKPVVGFDVGGMSEVVEDGKTGYLVPYGDSAAFVGAVGALLGDSSKLAEFSKQAWRSAERFSVETHVRRLIECYRDAAPREQALTVESSQP